MRTDSLGNLLWSREYGDPVDDTERFTSVVQTSDDGFLLAGSRVDQWGSDGYLMKVDSLGNEEWDEVIGDASYSDTYCRLHELVGTDEFILTGGRGVIGAPPDTEKQAYARRIEEDGTIVWETLVGNIGSRGSFTSAIEDQNGDIVCVGICKNEFGLNAGHAAKFDSQTGDPIWYHTYNHAPADEAIANEELWDIVEVPDTGYVMAGWLLQTFQQGFNSQDVWMLRVDTDGCLEPGCLITGLEEQVLGLQEVMSVFPNPILFGQQLTIRFEEQLGVRMPYLNRQTAIAVYSMDGMKVHEQDIPIQGSNSSFDFKVTLPELASGVYSVHWTDQKKWLDSVPLIIE